MAVHVRILRLSSAGCPGVSQWFDRLTWNLSFMLAGGGGGGGGPKGLGKDSQVS